VRRVDERFDVRGFTRRTAPPPTLSTRKVCASVLLQAYCWIRVPSAVPAA
jgi:hypothetical protein